MKTKLTLFSFSLALFFIGLLCAIGIGMQWGAVIVLSAAFIIAGVYVVQLYQSFKGGTFMSITTLSFTLAGLVVVDIFLLGFSLSINMGLFGFPGFYPFHVLSGFILIGLFSMYSIQWIRKIEMKNARNIMLAGFVIACMVSVIGFLGFARIVPGTERWIYFSFVFLTFGYFLYFLLSVLLPAKSKDPDNWKGLLISSMMLLIWLFKSQASDLIAPGFYRVFLQTALAMMVVLPLSIWLIKKAHFLTIFVLTNVLIELFFISYNRDFRYLVDVGGSECVGYDAATDYPVVTDPGIPYEELFKAPTSEELNEILEDWKTKDFTPTRVKVEYSERKANGDSIKVISHYVNEKKHYGIIRIPAGVDIKNAPILLALQGGGAGLDVTESNSLNRISSGICRDVLAKYITISPSFRGDIIRGDGFCFRSEGYTGDVWLGPAEDAVSFLEVVKAMYSRSEGTKVLAMGVSRGATVALIIGALTQKVDYIISISTHTNFHDLAVFRQQRVGGDFPRVFFTPKATPQQIRKRLIASSPYYFADRLPNFEIHQGTNDTQTTVFHAEIIKQRLQQIGRNDSTFKIYIYEGKGHGYDDDALVCKSLRDFTN